MPPREHDRVPLSVQVEFRNASSFLVAYSVNLSRGGMFLETDNPAPVGAEIALSFAIPGSGEIALSGRVIWRREPCDGEGPTGMGVEFYEMGDTLGAVIDRLAADFAGLSVLLFCVEDNRRTSLTRKIRSIFSTADVVGPSEARLVEPLLDDPFDLAVIEAESAPEAALATLTSIRTMQPRLPAVVISGRDDVRDRARAVGAAELVDSPPQYVEFQRVLLRALGRPALIK